MSQTMLWMVVALVGEVVLLLLVLLTVSWLRSRASRRRDAKAMQALVDRIRKSKSERETALAQFLGGNFGLEGEALSSATAGLLGSELKMLQRFISVYGSRDATAAAQFDNDLADALQPYQALSGAPAVPESAAEVPGVDPAELEALKAENKRLSDELRITMETMSRMLNEYSTMFAGAPGDEAAPITPPVSHVEEAAVADEPAAEDAYKEAGPTDDQSVVLDPDVSVVLDEEAVFDGLEAPPVSDAVESEAAAGSGDSVDELSRAGDGQVLDDGAASEPEVGDGDAGSSGQDAGPPDEEPSAVAPPETAVDIGTDVAPDAQADGLLFEEPIAESDATSADKGADVEAISELLIEGESELLHPDGSDNDEPDQTEPLFDADEDLFDAASNDEPDAGLESPLAQDDIDDLFDADEPFTDEREKASKA